MTRKQQVQDDLAALRRRAELTLSQALRSVGPEVEQGSMTALVHELKVHQVELEMQCEELQRAQKATQDSLDRYVDLYESAPVAYLTVGADLKIEQVNHAGERLLGFPRSDTLGHPVAEFVVEEDVLRCIDYCRAVQNGGDPVACEIGLRSLTDRKTALMDARRVSPDDQRLRLALTDITERKQAENRVIEQRQALAESQTELQALSGRLLSLEDDIRRRTAQQLQDEFSQRLMTLVSELAILEETQEWGVGASAKLRHIKQRLSHLGVDLHYLGQRLHSGFLEHRALHLAMKEYIEDLNMLARPQVAFDAVHVPVGCPSGHAVALFRVLQECLRNIFTHADATHIDVILAGRDQNLVLTVRDDGCGFDPRLRYQARAGFGLIIMRERMRAIGGTLAVESRSRQGTTVTASIPWPS